MNAHITKRYRGEDIDIVNNALVDHCESNKHYYRVNRKEAIELFEAARRVTGIELVDLLEGVNDGEKD